MKPVTKLEPGLKNWLANVIIPALIREYLAEMQEQSKLAFLRDHGVVSISEPEELPLSRKIQ